MKRFLITTILMILMMFTVTVFASDYSDYKQELTEYNKCVRTAGVFSGGPECIEPVFKTCNDFSKALGYCPEYDVNTSVVYDNGDLHLNNIAVIQDHTVVHLKYVKMRLVDRVFVITEIVE